MRNTGIVEEENDKGMFKALEFKVDDDAAGKKDYRNRNNCDCKVMICLHL